MGVVKYTTRKLISTGDALDNFAGVPQRPYPTRLAETRQGTLSGVAFNLSRLAPFWKRHIRYQAPRERAPEKICSD